MQQPPQWGPQGYGPPPGYGYGPQGYPQQQPPKKGNATAIIIAVSGALVGLAILGAAAGKHQRETEKAIDVTPEMLSQDYSDNEIAADQKYKGRRVVITGTVDRIDSDITNDPVVKMRSRGTFMGIGIKGLSKSDAVSLKKGEVATFDCVGEGEVLSVPYLRNCKIP